MNARGNLIIGVLALLVAIMLLPLLIKMVFPEVDLVYKVILIFAVYSFVTQMLGHGSLSLLITGVLSYFMAFKYGDIFTSLWFVTFVLTYVSGTLIVTAARDFFGFGDDPGAMSHPPGGH